MILIVGSTLAPSPIFQNTETSGSVGEWGLSSKGCVKQYTHPGALIHYFYYCYSYICAYCSIHLWIYDCKIIWLQRSQKAYLLNINKWPMTLNWQIHSSIASSVLQCMCCSDHPAWMANNIPCLANYNLVFHTDQPEASLWSNYYHSDSVFLSLFPLRLFLACRYLCQSAETNAMVAFRS